MNRVLTPLGERQEVNGPKHLLAGPVLTIRNLHIALAQLWNLYHFHLLSLNSLIFSNNLDELLDFIPQLDKPHGLFFCDTATSLNCDKHVTRSHDNLVTPIAVWPSVFDKAYALLLTSYC